MDTAVAPAGDRLYVAGLNVALDNQYYPTGQATLRFLPLGRQQPVHWTLTTGFVLPLPFGHPFHLTALLGPATPQELATEPARPSALSQVLAVTGDCPYEFSFWGITESPEAVAEVIWRGGACSVQRTDRIPLQMPEIESQAELKNSGMSMEANTAVFQTLRELRLHRVRLAAPAGAAQAEIRFLVPPRQMAIVDTVSFKATADPSANGDLHQVENGVLAGWQLSPASASGVTIRPAGEAAMELANVETVPVSLVQSFAVTGEQSFELRLNGHIVGSPTPEQPEVRLAWLDAAGQPVGVSTLTIATGQPVHLRAATVPALAATADLHLSLPAGSRLVVQQISFTPVEMVTVPIHFLAQAPGQLTVTGFDVAYDLRDVATVDPPPEGLCPPTPPGRGAGGKGGCCRWCSSPCGPCEGQGSGPVAGTAGVTSRSLALSAPRRRAVLSETRPASIRQPAALTVRQPPPIQAVETAVAPMLRALPNEWAMNAPDLAALSVPLARIKGIGPQFTRKLTALGVESLPQLAAVAPDSIAAEISGISLDMALKMVAEAQSVAARPEALPPPLVSCIMPTFDRRRFVPQAIDLFLRQDYPNCELIILDDGTDPVGDLVPDDERIRYLHLPKMNVGAKRNLGGQEARGPILASWDDDVWVAPWRLRYQVAALIKYEADVCGLDNLLHYDPFAQRAWQSVRPTGRQPWMVGATFCYLRSFWQANPFPEVQLSEDIRFLRQNPEANIVALQAVDWLVDIIHGGNTSPRPTDSPLWFPYELARMEALLGDDMAFYNALGSRALVIN